MQSSICCTCLQQKPAMFFPLTEGAPGQPSYGEKLISLTPKANYQQVVNAVICHKCSYFLDQAYKFKCDCEMAVNRIFCYIKRISSNNNPIHYFASVEQATGLNLVLHKIDDTINNYSLILGVDDKQNSVTINDDSSDSSCCIINEDSDHIEISDTERSPSPLLEPLMPTLSPQCPISPHSETTEYQCKQCSLIVSTRQNLKKHKRFHDQALDTINANIKHHMITAEDIRSIIGISADQQPTITYTYFLDNPLQDHTYYNKECFPGHDPKSVPPRLSPQIDLKDHKDKKVKVPLYADLVGASANKYNPKPKTKYQKNKYNRKRRNVSNPYTSTSSTWQYNPNVVLIKDERLDERARNEAQIVRSQIVNIIPKCVHNFLDDSCRTKTTLLFGNICKCAS